MQMRKCMSALVLAAAVPAFGQSPESNPLLKEWQTPFDVPPFAEIKEEHYLPAIKEGMARVAERLEKRAPRYGYA